MHTKVASKTDLYANFRQSYLSGEFFATVHVRVVRLVERLLQLVKLVRRERRTISSMFLALSCLIVHVVVTVAAFDAVAQNGGCRFRRFAVVSVLCRPEN